MFRTRGSHARSRSLAITVLAAAAIAGGLAVAGVGSALAVGATFYVATTGSDANACDSAGSPCLTIQAAVDKAADGDTVSVAAGTYSANVTISGKQLTLAGAEAGVPAGPAAAPAGRDVTGGDGYTGESVIVGSLTVSGAGASGTVVDGLVIDTSGTSIYLVSEAGSTTIRNSIITGRGFTGGSGIEKQVTTSIRSYVIQNNWFKGGSYAMQFNEDRDGTTYLIDGNYFTQAERAIQTFGSSVGDYTITDNLFESVTVAVRLARDGATITGNTIRNLTGSGTTQAAVRVDINVTAVPIYSSIAQSRGITISNNDIYGGAYGVSLEKPMSGTTYTVTANRFGAYTQKSVRTTTPQAGSVITATGNAWGLGTGPTPTQNLAAAGSTIATAPWIYASTDDPARAGDPGFWPTAITTDQPCTTACFVDTATGSDDHSGTELGPFKTIQKGLTSVTAGGTVTVAAGTYAEALTVTKSVTLEGPNADVSPNDPTTLSGGLPTESGDRVAEAVVRPANGAGDALTISPGVADLVIAVRGFTFDLQDAAGSSSDDPNAARYITGTNNADLAFTVERNRFLNNPGATNGSWWLAGDNGALALTIVDNRFAGERYATNGISPWNYATGATTVLSIRDNVWVDNLGYTYNGGATAGTSGEIADNWIGNTTPGTGGVDNWTLRQSGFILTSAHDGLHISGNTFRDLEYAAVDFWDTFSGTVLIDNNRFDGYSNMGEAYFDAGTYAYDMLIGPKPVDTAPDLTGVILRQNSFTGGTAGSLTIANRPSGGTIDARGNWWGCAGGANTVGCGTTIGSVTTEPFIGAYTMPGTERAPGFWPATVTIGLPEIVTPTTVPLAGATLGSPSIEIAGASAGATVEVAAPTAAELPPAEAPFSLSGATFIDIQVSGSVTGPFTICLDGNRATDKLWHYEGGAWVDMTWRDLPSGTLDPAGYPASQICGKTDTLSPFASSGTKTTLTVTPDPQTISYGDPAPVTADYTFDVTGFVGGETAITASNYVPPTCSSNYAQGDAAGTYAITCTGGSADDYDFDLEATDDLTVETVAITVQPDAYGGTVVYGDAEPSFTAYSVTSGALITGDTWATSPACGSDYDQGDPASTYSITCSGGVIRNAALDDMTSSYDITYDPRSLVVGTRAITVKADDKTITFGDAAPPYTSSITSGSLYAGDSWSTNPSCGATYTPGVTPAGTTPITCSGGAIANGTPTDVTSSYLISYAPGTLTIQSASTTTVYTGQTYDADGGTSTLTVNVSVSSAVCFVDSTVTATVTPVGGSALAPIALVDQTGSGASRTFSATPTLGSGVFEIDIAFDPAESCLPSSYDDAVLTVVSPGDTANGGGWYRLDKGGFSGSPRVNFGFAITKSTSKTGIVSYRGRLLWMNNGQWRLAGTIASTGSPAAYGLTTCPPAAGTATDRRCASFTGSGVLQYWDGDSWETSTYGTVTFTVTVYDGGTSKVTQGKKTTTVQNPDWFGIQIDPVPSNVIRESTPIQLSGGSIKAS